MRFFGSYLWLLFGFSAGLAPCLLNPTIAVAAPLVKSSYHFSSLDMQLGFLADESARIALSAKCHSSGHWECDAFDAIQRLDHGELGPLENEFRANPGALVCAKLLREKVIIGTDSRQNQNSFCQFPDGSLADCGSLYFHYRHGLKPR